VKWAVERCDLWPEATAVIRSRCGKGRDDGCGCHRKRKEDSSLPFLFSLDRRVRLGHSMVPSVDDDVAGVLADANAVDAKDDEDDHGGSNCSAVAIATMHYWPQEAYYSLGSSSCQKNVLARYGNYAKRNLFDLERHFRCLDNYGSNCSSHADSDTARTNCSMT